MPGKALGKEEILRGPVDVRDGRVAEGVEVVGALKAGRRAASARTWSARGKGRCDDAGSM